MKKKLAKLETAVLKKIAGDLGCPPTNDREKMIEYIADYLKSYGLQWIDLKCRYKLD